MNRMKSVLDTLRTWHGALVVLLVTAVFIAMQYTPSPSPIAAGDATAAARVVKSRSAVVVDYSINYKVIETVAATVGKSIECDGVSAWYAGVEIREFTEPSITVKRFFEVPKEIPVGTRCELVFSVLRQDRFSIRPQYNEIARVPLTVGVE